MSSDSSTADSIAVEAYFDAQPEPQRATLLVMRASLRKLLPGATEAMSYQMPTFKIDGSSLGSLAGFKNHCSYFPHGTEVLARLANDLRAYDVDKGTLRFPIDAPLPLAVLRKLVATRIAMENATEVETGKVRNFYDNGFLRYRGSMRNGQAHGAWTFFRKDGTLMRSGSFKNGEQTGSWQTFERNGTPGKITTF